MSDVQILDPENVELSCDAMVALLCRVSDDEVVSLVVMQKAERDSTITSLTDMVPIPVNDVTSSLYSLAERAGAAVWSMICFGTDSEAVGPVTITTPAGLPAGVIGRCNMDDVRELISTLESDLVEAGSDVTVPDFIGQVLPLADGTGEQLMRSLGGVRKVDYETGSVESSDESLPSYDELESQQFDDEEVLN